MSEERRPLTPTTQSGFERDLKLLKKRGWKSRRLTDVVEMLCARRKLGPRYRDHALIGDWKGYRDCHIAPDWVLIYRVDEAAGELILARTGTHVDLFE